MPPGAYTIEIEYLLTWYPLRGARHLDGPRIIGGTLTDSDPNGPAHSALSVGPPTKDAVEDSGVNVTGFVNLSPVPENGFYLVVVQVNIPAVSRVKTVVVQPDTTVPFMINALASVDDQFANHTGVTFEGVITTGHRRGLSDLINDYSWFRP